MYTEASNITWWYSFIKRLHEERCADLIVNVGGNTDWTCSKEGLIKLKYGIKNYCSIIPGSMFEENDNFGLEDSHVIPNLIHKCYFGKKDDSLFEV